MSNLVHFNTVEAAKILGVNISTIKRWTDSGKLECLRTLGGHRKFTMEQISNFIEKNNNGNNKVNAFPLEKSDDLQLSQWVLKRDFSKLIEYTKNQALLCNRKSISDVLQSLYLAQYPLFTIYDDLVSPVLNQIGDLWNNGIISIIEEHFVSQTMKDCIVRLQSMISLPAKKQGVVMCMSMFDDMHDLGLKMVDHILEYRGYKVLYSGQMTPKIKLNKIFENYSPQRLYISSNFVKDPEKSQKEFDTIIEITDFLGIDVYVGGKGFDVINWQKSHLVKKLKTFKEVYEK